MMSKRGEAYDRWERNILNSTILLCLNNKCKARKSCYRFMAKPARKYHPHVNDDLREKERCGIFLEIVKEKIQA